MFLLPCIHIDDILDQVDLSQPSVEGWALGMKQTDCLKENGYHTSFEAWTQRMIETDFLKNGYHTSVEGCGHWE